MSTRRSFLIKAPIGLAAAVTACSSKGEAAAGVTLAGGAQAPQGGSAPTPLMPIPANAPVLEYIPKHEELTYTFGGVPAVRRIKPGTRIVSWTEDCFDGAVRTASITSRPARSIAAARSKSRSIPARCAAMIAWITFITFPFAK